MFGSMFKKASKAIPDSQGKHHEESAKASPDKPWQSHPPPPPVLSGVPTFSLVLAVDHVQGLVAVGNELGEVHLWGEANAEQRLPSPSTDGPSPVREIHFLVNEGRMLVVHAPSLMCLWSLHGKSAALVATATVPSTLAMGLHVPRSPYFLFGTERNAIVLAFRVADDKIKPATWSRSFVNAAFVNGMPMVGKVMALALRPADPSLSLLVGVHHGALLVAKLAEPDSKPAVLGVHPDARVGLTAAVWLDASGLLAAGYDNGDALVWSLRNPSAPTARIQLSDFGPTGLPMPTAAVARGPSGVVPPPPPPPGTSGPTSMGSIPGCAARAPSSSPRSACARDGRPRGGACASVRRTLNWSDYRKGGGGGRKSKQGKTKRSKPRTVGSYLRSGGHASFGVANDLLKSRALHRHFPGISAQWRPDAQAADSRTDGARGNVR